VDIDKPTSFYIRPTAADITTGFYFSHPNQENHWAENTRQTLVFIFPWNTR